MSRTIQNIVTYVVVVSAPNPEFLLEPGMNVTTRIAIDRRDDVLRVPDKALTYAQSDHAPPTSAAGPGTPNDGSSRLWVLREGKAKSISVRLGLDDGAYTEVVAGDLKLGDELIIGASDGPSEKTTDAGLPMSPQEKLRN